MDAGPPTEGTATWHDLIVDQPTAFDTIQTMPDDTSVILYTSGTTGQPKGAELSHSNMVMNAIVSRDLMSSTAEDVTLIALPLYHSFGQTFLMNAALFAGGRIVLAPRFDPAIVFQLLQDEDVTLYAGVPTMYWELLNYPEADRFDIEKIARTLRIADSGGGPMPIDVMRQFEEKFGVLILEGYGLTETSPVATSNVALKVRKTGTIGLPIWGVEIRIVDEEMNDVPVGETGEIVIRGHNVMKGYYNRPEETAEAFRGGWLHTGDLGAFDDDGYITVVGRLKDLIIRSGFNIYPREIEEFLVSHPEITLAAVIGVPDPRCGEEIKAFVVLEAGSTLNADTIVALSKAELAAHKYPRMVEIIEELPMGPTGKILKTELRRREGVENP
jgi:long-chain acyl-CoA synthetase